MGPMPIEVFWARLASGKVFCLSNRVPQRRVLRPDPRIQDRDAYALALGGAPKHGDFQGMRILRRMWRDGIEVNDAPLILRKLKDQGIVFNG